MLLDRSQLAVRDVSKRRGLLDLHLTRQQRADFVQIDVRLLTTNLLDHLLAVLGEVVAQHRNRQLAELVARTQRTPAARISRLERMRQRFSWCAHKWPRAVETGSIGNELPQLCCTAGPGQGRAV